MKKSGGKKYIITIWVLLITLSFSCFGLLILYFINYDKKSDLGVDAEWALENGDGGDGDFRDNYDSNNVFTISAFATLQYFASTVNNGYSYAGKTVKLLANIDCGDSGIAIGEGLARRFSGTFDGNGKTISKYSPNGNQPSFEFSDRKAYGLFVQCDGTIKNLRIANSGRTISGGDYKAVGGIVGYSIGATITNCAVENFTIKTTDKTDRIFVAGIFAVGSATVSNCYVRDLSVENGCGAIAGIGCVYNYATFPWESVIYAWSASSSNVSSCIVRNVNATYTYCGNLKGSYFHYNHTITNCHTQPFTDGLDITSIWYYNYNYNDRYPYLRVFINFTKFYFDCNGDGSYETTRVSPYPATTIQKINESLTWSYINTYYDNDVEKDLPNGKYFDGWRVVDNYHYQAIMVDEEYGLRFNMPTDIECELIIGDKTHTLNSENPSVDVTNFDNGINIVNYNQSVSVNNRFENGYLYVTYQIGSIIVTYKMSNIYYLEDYGQYSYGGTQKGEITNAFKIPDGGNRGIYDIKPNVQLKSYGTQWG